MHQIASFGTSLSRYYLANVWSKQDATKAKGYILVYGLHVGILALFKGMSIAPHFQNFDEQEITLIADTKPFAYLTWGYLDATDACANPCAG